MEIAASIERLIRFGQWRPGQQLPALRALAGQLGVNPNTVAAAYKLLRDAGTVQTDGRRGTRVADVADAFAAQSTLAAGLRDLASGNVDEALLPRLLPEWFAERPHISGYDARSDHAPLLALAAEQLFRPAGADGEIVLFSGVLDAVERALMQRCRPGSAVLVEDPCWPPLLALLANLRLKPVPLRLDSAGVVPPSQDELQQAAAVVLTARAQNPTGVGITRERWQAWQFALARAADCLLVIDDHWGPLSAEPPPPLAAFSSEWIYVHSVSKFLGPDLRVAFAAGNGPVLRAMQRRHALGPRWVSTVLQRIVALAWQQMLDEGAITRVGQRYQARREALRQALMGQGVALAGGGEGLHLWLPVHNETAVVQVLASRGWAIQAGKPFRLLSAPAVRICSGTVEGEEVDWLAADIAAALRPATHAIY